jgi:hypothetical protein
MRLRLAQRDDAALGAPAHGAAHMRDRGRARAGRQDEFLQRQRRVVLLQQRVQPRHVLFLDHLVAGDAQFAAQVEQVVLDRDQLFAQVGRHVFAQQQPDEGVQFIDLAQRMDAHAVLFGAAAVAQSGGAVVAGAGGDF